MDLNASELRGLIDLRKSEILALEIEQLFIWLAKHRAAKQRRSEHNRFTTQVFHRKLLLNVRLQLHEDKNRLVRLMEISFSAMLKVKASIQHATESVDDSVQTASRHDSMKHIQRLITEHPLGREWMATFDRLKQFDDAILKEKQHICVAETKLKEAKKVQEVNARSLKNDIRRTAAKLLN